jgi:hypothetical protein
MRAFFHLHNTKIRNFIARLWFGIRPVFVPTFTHIEVFAVTVLSLLRSLLVPQPHRRPQKTLFQRCLAIHIAATTASGALS